MWFESFNEALKLPFQKPVVNLFPRQVFKLSDETHKTGTIFTRVISENQEIIRKRVREIIQTKPLVEAKYLE